MGIIAKKVEDLAPSGIRQFFDLVLGMPEVVSLGVGEPDFVTPWHIREKAITALEEGYTSYTSNKGLVVLRKGIRAHLLRKFSLDYDFEEEILITVGVSEGLDLALRAIINPGDKVIVVSPYYVAYPALVEIPGGKVLLLKTKPEDEFKIDIDELKKLLKQKPKAIILNYPANPTGTTYSRGELKKIWQVISKTDTIVITDEAYDELTYQDEHPSFAGLDKKAKKQTILLNGFSKAYAMTGFRVGYACASKEIIAAMMKIHSFSMLCCPILSQIAATEALRTTRDTIEMRKEYHRRRDFMVEELNRIGLTCHKPNGAFYCFPSIKKSGLSSMDFAKRLLFEEKVAVVPGTAFGDYDNYVRMSYATAFDNLKKAISRMEQFLMKLSRNQARSA